MKRTQGLLCTNSTVQLCCPSCEEHYVSSLVSFTPNLHHQYHTLFFTCSLSLYCIWSNKLMIILKMLLSKVTYSNRDNSYRAMWELYHTPNKMNDIILYYFIFYFALSFHWLYASSIIGHTDKEQKTELDKAEVNLWTHSSYPHCSRTQTLETKSVQNWSKICEHVCVSMWLTEPSANADITLPRDDRDLLMFLASSSTAPSAPVLLTCERMQEFNTLCSCFTELQA